MYIAKFMRLKRKGKFCHFDNPKNKKSSAIDLKELCEKMPKLSNLKEFIFKSTLIEI
jgi:hypothetical protein